MIPMGLRAAVLDAVAISISRCWPTRGAGEPAAVVDDLLAGWSAALGEWGAGDPVELQSQLRAGALARADRRDCDRELRGHEPMPIPEFEVGADQAREALRLWIVEHQPGDYDLAEPLPEHRADGWHDEDLTVEAWKLAVRDARQEYEAQCSRAGVHELRALRQITADVAMVYRIRHDHPARQAADQCVGALYAARAVDGNEGYAGSEAWAVIVRALQQRLGRLLSWHYV